MNPITVPPTATARPTRPRPRSFRAERSWLPSRADSPAAGQATVTAAALPSRPGRARTTAVLAFDRRPQPGQAALAQPTSEPGATVTLTPSRGREPAPSRLAAGAARTATPGQLVTMPAAAPEADRLRFNRPTLAGAAALRRSRQSTPEPMEFGATHPTRPAAASFAARSDRRAGRVSLSLPEPRRAPAERLEQVGERIGRDIGASLGAMLEQTIPTAVQRTVATYQRRLLASL